MEPLLKHRMAGIDREICSDFDHQYLDYGFRKTNDLQIPIATELLWGPSNFDAGERLLRFILPVFNPEDYRALV